MNPIRFSGACIMNYKFDPKKVPFSDREAFGQHMISEMGRAIGANKVDYHDHGPVDELIGQQKDKTHLQLAAYALETPTPTTLTDRLLSALRQKAPQTVKQLIALVLHDRDQGTMDIFTINYNRHDAAVETVYEEDFAHHLPFSALEDGAVQYKGGFAIKPEYGSVTSEQALNKVLTFMLGKLSNRLRSLSS